jgi:hypothetical protein
MGPVSCRDGVVVKFSEYKLRKDAGDEEDLLRDHVDDNDVDAGSLVSLTEGGGDIRGFEVKEIILEFVNFEFTVRT